MQPFRERRDREPFMVAATPNLGLMVACLVVWLLDDILQALHAEAIHAKLANDKFF